MRASSLGCCLWSSGCVPFRKKTLPQPSVLKMESACSSALKVRHHVVPKPWYTTKYMEQQTKITYVRFQVLTAASMKFRVFWDVAPCSHVEVDRRFRGAYCLHHQGALMMEAVRTSETSVNFNLTTRRYIPEDSKLHTRRRENFKTHNFLTLRNADCMFVPNFHPLNIDDYNISCIYNN